MSVLPVSDDAPDETGGASLVLPRKYVHPGSVYFTRKPALVTTILGSCVAVCLFEAEGAAAGLNHYLLPDGSGQRSTKYAEVANEELLARFLEMAISIDDIRAKVFGGAAMGMFKSDLAQRNIDAAYSFLDRNRIPVISSDTGGHRGRKLLFQTADGSAWIRLL